MPKMTSGAGLKCVQCHVTETPLWRAGPAGPKTLCNACGVRYRKHGVLAPRNTVRRAGKKGGVKKKGGKKSGAANAKSRDAPSAKGSPRATRMKGDSKKNLYGSYGATGKIQKSLFRYGLNVNKGRYESIFSGLMVVQRPKGSGRKRLKTAKGRAYDEEKKARFELTSDRLGEREPDEGAFARRFDTEYKDDVSMDNEALCNSQYGGFGLLLAAAARADAVL